MGDVVVEGEVTLTIVLSWTCSSRLQPTPHYGQMVVVCSVSSHVPARRMLCSLAGIRAPVDGRDQVRIYTSFPSLSVQPILQGTEFLLSQ